MTAKLPIPHPKASKTERRHVLTATDMMRLARGDWRGLWDEKLGHSTGEDFTFNWKAKLGLATENIHAWWHEHQTGHAVEPLPDRPMYMPHHTAPAHHAATFDRWIPADDCPLEMKHTYARNNLVDAAQFYMPQLQWQLHVAGRDRLRFSIIRGNEEPEWGWVSADVEYQKMQQEMAASFWSMVENNTPPADFGTEVPADDLAARAKQVPINGFKGYDHTTNNEWIVLEAQYVAQKKAADQFKATDKELRALIPGDALQVKGKLTLFKRDARGAYRCTILEEND